MKIRRYKLTKEEKAYLFKKALNDTVNEAIAWVIILAGIGVFGFAFYHLVEKSTMPGEYKLAITFGVVAVIYLVFHLLDKYFEYVKKNER